MITPWGNRKKGEMAILPLLTLNSFLAGNIRREKYTILNKTVLSLLLEKITSLVISKLVQKVIHKIRTKSRNKKNLIWRAD